MKKIVVIDDNGLSVEGICRNIDWDALGAEVAATFDNARDALEYLRESEADLIISDIAMPQMSGIEMSKMLLLHRPHQKIILISAYDDFEYAKEALRLGVSDYVEKPLDYGYLADIAAKTLEQAERETKMLEQLRMSRPALVHRFYHDLLAASPDYAEYALYDQARYIELDLSPAQYVCAVIQIDQFVEARKTLGMERYHLLVLGLCDELERAFRGQASVYCHNEGDSIVLIVGASEADGDAFNHTVYQGLLALHEKYENGPLSTTIGIGDAVTGIWNVSASYQAAKQALGYKFMFAESRIFNIRDIRANKPAPVFFTVGAEEKLIQLISQKNIPGIRAFADSLAAELSEHYYDKSGVISFIYSLLARLIRFFYDTGIDAGEIRNDIADLFSDLEQVQNCEQICEGLYEICVKACGKLQESVETFHNQIAGQVIQYIENHYMNADLGLKDIASNVNVSPAYLGVMFKKTKGQNISDFLSEYRVTKACELLSHTQQKIMEISERVGYSNPYYFSASFKKRTGMTPSSYRSQVLGIPSEE